VLYPEKFQSLDFGPPDQLAKITGAQEYTITSNATGNGFFVLRPDLPTTTAVGGNGFAFGNPTTFNSATGVYTGGSAFTAPLVGLTSTTCFGTRMVACSLQFIPTLSANVVQGSYTIAPFYMGG